MSLSIICAHRWGMPVQSSMQNDKGEMTQVVLRYCPGCVTTWRTDMVEPRITISYLEDSEKPAKEKK